MHKPDASPEPVPPFAVELVAWNGDAETGHLCWARDSRGQLWELRLLSRADAAMCNKYNRYSEHTPVAFNPLKGRDGTYTAELAAPAGPNETKEGIYNNAQAS